MPKKIEQILDHDEAAHIAQFNQQDKDWINNRIHDRADGEAGIECIIRGKNDGGDYFKLTPEEIVRQYYAYKLIEVYGYSKDQIQFELPVSLLKYMDIRKIRFSLNFLQYLLEKK